MTEILKLPSSDLIIHKSLNNKTDKTVAKAHSPHKNTQEFLNKIPFKAQVAITGLVVIPILASNFVDIPYLAIAYESLHLFMRAGKKMRDHLKGDCKTGLSKNHDRGIKEVHDDVGFRMRHP